VTTIAAIQGDSWAVIAYDSRITEDSRLFTLPGNSGKVAQNGPYLLGAAGDLRAINLLHHVFRPPAPPPGDKGVKLDKFISSKFVPALKACFDEAQYGEKGSQDSSVIVVINGTVYEIGSNYEWCHDEGGIYAIGTGSSYALGALYESNDGRRKKTLTTARSSLKSALTIASALDVNTGGSIHVITQKSDVI
jgi:ATP-dependent protease HslVU (ClpYQ) peptidase subunit